MNEGHGWRWRHWDRKWKWKQINDTYIRYAVYEFLLRLGQTHKAEKRCKEGKGKKGIDKRKLILFDDTDSDIDFTLSLI